VQYEARLVGVAVAQQCGQVAIDFYDLEPSCRLQQPLRQCALAGPDFHRGITRGKPDGGHDARNDRRIMQEVLTETLACAAVRRTQERSWRDAMRPASSIAASRLPASPLPLPARSSAVP
jgi:hypothetical protein